MSEPNRYESFYEQEQRPRKRSAPWLLGGLVLLLLSVLVVLQVFGLWEVFTPDTATDTLLLYALSSLNFAAFIVFTFIFVRNLLKLRRERRERQLGSKMKTRLVVYFIAVSLLPITGMAVFSYLFFNRSMEKWFSSPPEDVVNEARLAQKEQLRQQAESLGETTRAIATMLDAQAAAGQATGSPASDSAAALLPQILSEANLSYLALVPPGESGMPLVEASAPQIREEDKRHLLLASIEPSATRQAEVGTGGNFYNVQAVATGNGYTLVAARARVTDESLVKLVEGARRFEDFKRRQRKVRLLGLSTLGLLTLLLLFAATWSAIHLARGISTPIRALAEAADEVARGNLGHRVTAIADDELAVLAASFNQMTAQLQENRRHIEAGAAELREKNLALAERRDYIETVLASLSTGVISLDEQDRVTTINPTALVMLRLEHAPAAGTPLADIVSASDYALLERVLRRARLRGRAAEQGELARNSSTTEAGTSVPVALTATALRERASAGRGVVLVMEDLSELLAAQRAAAWSEVARRMAHEIKNPLTPIQLSAERIARSFSRSLAGQKETNGRQTAAGNGANGHSDAPIANAADADGERVARIVEECTSTITREVAGLKAMVDEFSRFARLPHARLEPADLNEVARQALTLYQERTGDVRLDVRLAHALPGAMLDAEQIRRVFVNLIENALEAVTDFEGEPRVTVATGHDPSRGVLLAEVADTGHGISRADFSRLFQPYFSTRGRGTGLGLAIVQRIITEHGGRIRAEANRPRGARFIFELPVAETEVRG